VPMQPWFGLFRQDSCGGNITISSAGYVTSPGYPSPYPNSTRCVWLIRAPDPQQKILINFNPHFDLENRECKYDYVEVYDGDSEEALMVGKFCGKISPPALLSTGNSLLIKFISDYETNGAGFSIRYEVYQKPGNRMASIHMVGHMLINTFPTSHGSKGQQFFTGINTIFLAAPHIYTKNILRI
uniref:CUB domain-containing protein n=1 Tax=Astyanax mexicanus TaxID=7994 RepID=A0A3B1JHW6_ASTMX